MSRCLRPFAWFLFFSLPACALGATIDFFTFGATQTYTPAVKLFVLDRAGEYVLDDGTRWASGAGSFSAARLELQGVERSGDTLRYTFHPPADGILWQQTDYNAGEHSSQGTLGAAGPIVLTARDGAAEATLTGFAEVLANDATHYENFYYFSAPVGTLARFRVTYTLTEAVWSESLFDGTFSYLTNGVVYFVPPEKGDVDGDGRIRMADAIIPLQVLAGAAPPATPFYSAADVDGDGRVGLGETLYALRWVSGQYNRPPLLTPVGDRGTDENVELAFSLAASDPEGDPLTFQAADLPAGATLDPQTGAFAWTPGYDAAGTYTVTFSVTDRFGAADSETVTLTVADVPVFVAARHFPLAVGNWWRYRELPGGALEQVTVSGTKVIAGVETRVVAYPDGSREFYSADTDGLKLHGLYLQMPEYTGDVLFDTPLLLLPDYAPVGTVQVSTANYTIPIFIQGYGTVMVGVQITVTTQVLGVESVQTQNALLAGCLKVSRQVSEYLSLTGETFIEDPTIDWVYDGIGVVKEVSPEDAGPVTRTITQAFVDQVLHTY